MNIRCKAFHELTVHELYDLLQLRSEVFVIEQNCIYQDMDGIDQKCHHLLVYKEDSLEAYARLIPNGLTFKENSIGRIITRNHGRGFGSILMKETLKKMRMLFDNCPIRIGAQTYAIEFYKKFGFIPEGEVYEEDGIEHIEMVIYSIPKSYEY